MIAFLGELHRRDPLLSVVAWVHLALAAAFLVGIAIDTRVVLGLNPWIKPLKFALSIAIYLFTVAWLLGEVRGAAPLAARAIGIGAAVALATETVCISLQSMRGVPSHFNVGSPFDGSVFAIMGLMILLNTLLAAWLLWLFLTVPSALPRPQLLGVRLGLALFLAGSAIGPMMVSRGAHAVGVPDGGPGLPFVNWSTEGGDLRIAHAIGLHALQVLPVLAWGLARLGWGDGASRTTVVLAVAAGWLLLLGAALTQALRGRPVL